MLYVSEKYGNKYLVTDSVTGGSIIVEVQGDRFYHNARPYDMKHVIGCLNDGSIIAVPKHLLTLISYMSIFRCFNFRKRDESFLRLCNFSPDIMSEYDILMKWKNSTTIYSVLDLVMLASYDEGFTEMLRSGVLKLQCGIKCFEIQFCGDYMSAVFKIITMYRETSQCQERLKFLFGRRIDSNGLIAGSRI